jgi:DNA-binding HxlR family transcriptional regulator
MTRTYGQYCGLARALDVVGDRWTLLIVRQLLLGPARYGQLLEGLPGIATNLLADRLRALEDAGIIERQLSDRHNAVVYTPTPWGAALREPIESLIRWSTPLMVRGPEGDTFRDEWLVLALQALLAGKRSTRPATIGIETNEGLIGLHVTPTGVEVRRAESREPFDAIVRADPAVVLGLAAGELTLHQVAADIIIDGEEQAVRTAFEPSSATPSP